MIKKVRIVSCFLAVWVLFGALEMRLYYIQVLCHSPFKKISGTQFSYEEHLPPNRGRILDRNGEELATLVNVYSVFAVPRMINNPADVSVKLAPFLGVPASELREKLTGQGQFAWLKRKISVSPAEAIRTMHLDGIYLLKEKERFYPEEELASQTVGYVGIDNQGLAGIEKSFDWYLKSRKNKMVKMRDALGRDIFTGETDVQDKTCSDVVLTIDKYIQHIAEMELRKAYVKTGAKKATVVIQDPSTGEILALANFPSFNGNEEPSRAYRYLKNPAVSDFFEPGSTFKVVTAAAALETNAVRVSDRFYCENGCYVFGNYPIRDHEKEGWLTFEEIVEKSSNIGMAKIGEKLGREKIYEYARKLGFGNETGIKLPGETRGMLRKINEWSGISVSRISFGQEIGVTAIQLVSAFSCIANNGILMEPIIVRRVVNADGKDIRTFPSTPVRQAISPDAVNMLKGMLTGVVERGTGGEARVSGYKVAGKTGTAQKFDARSGGYASSKYIASFIGFLPASNPRVTILVMIDEPRGVYWGGSIAAPVFSSIGTQVMDYLNVPWDSYQMARTEQTLK